MGSRQTIRSLLWGFCLAIVIFGARSARAAAPMCDETATSRVAPPPVLPIRDVKLEAGSPCDTAPLSDQPASVVPVGSRAPTTPLTHSDAATIEAWVNPNDVQIDPSSVRRSRLNPDAFVHTKPGFSPGVFRPPRG